jgi:N utilization substance protein A
MSVFAAPSKWASHFDEEYFDNFDIELDSDEYGEQGFRVLANKTIVEEVTNPDHQISLAEVQEVAPEAQAGDTVVLDVTPEQRDFGRMAAIQTKQVLAQKLRDQQRKTDSGRISGTRRDHPHRPGAAV